MSKGSVYLAGPITGLKYGEANDWREYAINFLAGWDVEGLSPMRGKDYLANVGVIAQSYDDVAEWPLSAAPGFTMRDRWDVMHSDLVLANFEGATTVSIGTVLECAWADAFRKPLIVVLDSDVSPEGWRNPNDHAMVRQLAGFVVPSLDKALAIIPAILNAREVVPPFPMIYTTTLPGDDGMTINVTNEVQGADNRG